MKKNKISVSSSISFGTLTVHFSGTMGFGSFFIYKSSNSKKIHCSNECCSLRMVKESYSYAVKDFIYSDSEYLSSKESVISKTKAKHYFQKKGFNVLWCYSSLKKKNNNIELSFIVANNKVVTLTFNESKFPDISDEGMAIFTISDYLQNKDWDDSFVSAKEEVWTKELKENVTLKDENHIKEFSKITYNTTKKHIVIKWYSPLENGVLKLSASKSGSGVMIDTQGKSKEFVLRVFDCLLNDVVLDDTY